MKKSYWLILVFLLWCVGAALWYMFGVREITTDPARFNATRNLLAIAEIMVMILGAFFIGFGLAWTLRGETIQVAELKWQESESKIQQLEQELAGIRKHSEDYLRKLLQVEDTVNKALVEKERYRELAEKGERQVQLWQKESREQEAKAQQLDSEVTSIRFRLRLLESELNERNQDIEKLKQSIEQSGKSNIVHRDWSDHPFVRPTSSGEEEKDDLTQIKGIGPKFMQKLNSLDIFSFRQISELSGEAVERLAEVIEVFPDRIHRDNWVGQATKLYLKKINKE